MDVDHRHPLENARGNDPSVGRHHPQVGATVGDVVEAVAHRQSELERSRLHRARGVMPAPTAPRVGTRHDEGDVVAGRMQRVQRRNGDLGCTQVHEP